MALAPNLQRRVAVYHWRKRLPANWALAIGRTHLSMSLGTRDPVPARFLAGQLDALADTVFMLGPDQGVTNEQLTTLFRNVFVEAREKYALLADSRRGQVEFVSETEREANRSAGWAYRLIARKGLSAKVDAGDRSAMEQAGLDQIGVEAVETTMNAMQADGRAKPSIARLRAAMRAVGAPDDARTITRASPIYLRAIGDALVESAERYCDDPLPFADLIPAFQRQDIHLPADMASEPKLASASDPADGKLEAARRGEAPAADAEGEASSDGEQPTRSSTTHVVTKLLKAARQDERWNDKSRRQAAATYDLFSRFLKEEHGLTDFADLEQHHLSDFDDLLRIIPKTYGKDGKGIPPLKILRERGKSLPPDKKGLSITTRNRHYTFLGVLLKAAKTQGVKLDPDLDIAAFRGQTKRRARNERSIPKEAVFARFFQASVFTGCRSWERLDEPGPEIFHRAAYFGPLLAYYHGLRREEFCGLAVEDVVHEGVPRPYIIVQDNTIRTLKNPQSDRTLTLHTELIRLGFIDYVKTIADARSTHLFPDLVSPSTLSPLGDRFYDELVPILREVNVTPHQMRHFFNNELKQRGTPEELRADLLGHGGKTETSERYVDPIALMRQMRLLKKLPVLTKHLVPSPIRLIPWIAARQPAPWARPRKAPRVRDTRFPASDA